MNKKPIGDIERSELERYIRDSLSKGYSISFIRKVLLKSRIKKSVVDAAFSKVKNSVKAAFKDIRELENYIRKNFDHGYSISAISKVLVKTGVEKSLLKKALGSFRETLIARLQPYIKENIRKGYSYTSIKKILLKTKVERFVVDEALKRVKSGIKQALGKPGALETYVKTNLAGGYSLSASKKILVQSGLSKGIIDNAAAKVTKEIEKQELDVYIKESVKKARPFSEVNKVWLPAVFVFMLVLMTSSFLVFRLTTVGLAPEMPEIIQTYEYGDGVNLIFNKTTEYIWYMENPGLLKSLRLDGILSKGSYAAVYLEYENESYVVFDSDNIEDLVDLTGFAVANEIETALNESELASGSIISVNESFGESLENESGDLDNKSIILTTAQSTMRAKVDELVVFNISATFNWAIGEDKLCTKWDVNEVSLCYGADDCCALVGLSSLGSWDENLFLSYARYGAGFSNVIRSQIIYADYSLDIENPYSEIVYSKVKETAVEFYEPGIPFEGVCVDTCELNFNASSYRLRIVVDGSIEIKDIIYSIERKFTISRNPPLLIKDIENITIYKNELMKINLSEYFFDEDGDELVFTITFDEPVVGFEQGDLEVVNAEVTNFTVVRYSDGHLPRKPPFILALIKLGGADTKAPSSPGSQTPPR